jgi:xylitol oxidase
VRQPITNWAGNVAFAASGVRRPRTVDELQDVVASSSRIRAVGSRHSFNRIADTTGELVSAAGLEIGLQFDDDEQTITVPAGARYGAVAGALHEHGRALANLGSLPHISVAGAAATGTHGSGDRNECLAASAVRVEFVQADGELVRVGARDAEFHGCVVALGALGVVARLTLATRPAFDLRQRVWQHAPLDAVLERFDDVMGCAYSVSLFSGPDRPDVVDQIWTKSHADDDPPDGTVWGALPATEALHPIAGQDARAATPQLGERHPSFEVLPHFRESFTPSSGDEQQSEYLIGREHGAAAVAAVCRLDLTEALQVMEIRTVAADEHWLSPAFRRDSVAIHFTWHNHDDAVLRACAAVERTLADFAPRAHWGKIFTLDAAAVRSCYPRLPDFQRLRSRHDPDGKFGNAFLADLVY